MIKAPKKSIKAKAKNKPEYMNEICLGKYKDCIMRKFHKFFAIIFMNEQINICNKHIYFSCVRKHEQNCRTVKRPVERKSNQFPIKMLYYIPLKSTFWN